jgi:hypothetical protein
MEEAEEEDIAEGTAAAGEGEGEAEAAADTADDEGRDIMAAEVQKSRQQQA